MYRPINKTPLSNDDVENTDLSYLVDRPLPHEPLVLSFGFVAWDRRPGFDFFGRLKKIESLTRKPLNKILVRDISNSWYHRDIEGLGAHVDEVSSSLETIIREIRPSRVITVGQSMGGYAAIMFGTLLNVDQIISFGPLSYLNSEEAVKYHDHRWLRVMRDLEKNRPVVCYFDLPRLCQDRGIKSQIDLFFGTKPDREDSTESVNLDAVHAQRFAMLSNCRLRPFPESGHTIVQYLSDHDLMDGLLIDLFWPSPKRL